MILKSNRFFEGRSYSDELVFNCNFLNLLHAHLHGVLAHIHPYTHTHTHTHTHIHTFDFLYDSNYRAHHKVAAVDYNDATEQRILALKEAAKLAHADATAARTERDKAVADAQADRRKMQQEKDRCTLATHLLARMFTRTYTHTHTHTHTQACI